MTIRQLEYRIQSLAELPFMVLEHAHWRPQAAKLRTEDKAKLREGVGSDAKNYRLLRKAWAREETWINCSLNALLMGLPQAMLAEVLAQHLGGFELPDSQIAKLGSGGIGDVVGDKAPIRQRPRKAAPLRPPIRSDGTGIQGKDRRLEQRTDCS